MNFKSTPVLVGTAGGALASTLPNIGVEQLLTTCFLAVLGATISFAVTLILKKLIAILKRCDLLTFYKSKNKR